MAGVVRLGLRGCAGDFRPYPKSKAKLLRGFKQARELGDEICISKRSLSLLCEEWISRDKRLLLSREGTERGMGKLRDLGWELTALGDWRICREKEERLEDL